ncbi:MAG: hypothetical protein VB111_01990 [Clostridiaceae bacterium]|nr:hypothetical protein [Clostridiaceae bacterium]
MENRVTLPLFDDYFLDFRPGTRRRWFSPEPYAMAPYGPYASMLADPERGLYRVYYETMRDYGADGPRDLRLVEGDDPAALHPVAGDFGSNIVFDGDGGLHGASILYDAYEADPSRRYKLAAMTRMSRERESWVNIPVVPAFSADGVHWEHHPETVLHPYTSDARNTLFYNPITRQYTLLHRSAAGDRRISMKTSSDLMHWSEPRVILHPGAAYNSDAAQTQHYSMTAGWFDGIFYGLLWRYNVALTDMDFSKMFGFMEPELVYSYDGQDFSYTTGTTLIVRPYPPNPGCMGLCPMDICPSLDGEWYYILCSGAVFPHGTSENNAKMHDALAGRVAEGNPIYRIRREGFCGLEATGYGARVITKCMELLSPDLRFNLRADCGWARFALMKPDGSYLPGFSFDDCVPYEFANGVAVAPVWREKTLDGALGQQIRVAVELNSTILHAIRATARPFIAQRQAGFGAPYGLEE